jgi:integrase
MGVDWVSHGHRMAVAPLVTPGTIFREVSMAWLEKRGNVYRINLDLNGQHVSRSLKTSDPDEASACLKRVEANLHEVGRGRRRMPPGADVLVFLLSDGDLTSEPEIQKALTLGAFFKRYEAGLPEGVKEANTRYIESIHIEHLLRLIGPQTAMATITTETLQKYVEARSAEEGRQGKALSHETIKKEIATLASAWNKYAVPQGLIKGTAPTKGLAYRKTKAKPPFQTWDQIERQIARGGLSKVEEKELWNSLFLKLPEIEELLDHVRVHAHARYIYIMFCIAAYTGARRSEMLRSRIEDFDFDADCVTIREKKRDRSKELTFRSVPMAPPLKAVLQEWFATHPGGQHTVCARTGKPVSVQMAAKGFRTAVDDSKWKVLLGWHLLRHSFASNCAAKSVDQRLIDAWMGHQTEEMRRRYRHLFPDQQREAIQLVFGAGGRNGK